MAAVHVFITNKSGGKVALTLDEDDSRIEYFRKLVKRDELDEVKVEKIPAKSSK